ncbi:MAG: phosphotransferase [Alphaproteobacteria bacterium]|nr:phosphotransferase [Alphaproteobacteria bacterium]
MVGIELDGRREGAELVVGRRLGPVVLELCSGIQGPVQVWRGRRWEPGSREVLRVEVLRSGDGDARSLRAEAARVRALGHRALLAPRGVGSVPGGRPYRVLPWIDGPTLADARRAGPLDPEDVRRVFRELADALAQAHAHGLGHGALTGECVVLCDDGPVITGLGLPACPRTTPRQLAPGASCVPPEAFRLGGHFEPVRADVYALGVLMYEAITGAPAFASEEGPAGALGLVERKLETWALVCPNDTPPELADLVRACTVSRAEERTIGLAEVRDRLDGLRPSAPVVRTWTPEEAGLAPEDFPVQSPVAQPLHTVNAEAPFSLHLLLPEPEDLPYAVVVEALETEAEVGRPSPVRVLGAVALACVPALVVLALTWPGLLGS